MFKCHFGKQAAWIITIEGRSIYVQDWFDGFLTQCLLRWKEMRRGGRRERRREEELKMRKRREREGRDIWKDERMRRR